MKNDLSTNQTIVNVQCDQMLEQKAAQLIQKLCQNVATLVFDYKVMILKIAEKLQNNWATFVSKFVKNIRNCPIWSR